MPEIAAGRELDALIATKVMQREPNLHWNVLNADETASCFHGEDRRECEAMLAGALHHHPDSWMKEYHVGVWKSYPRYSTSIADAWDVVEKMRDLGWSFRYGNNGCCRDQNAAGFARGFRGLGADILTGDYIAADDAVRVAGTPPLAICRAALAALRATEASA